MRTSARFLGSLTALSLPLLSLSGALLVTAPLARAAAGTESRQNNNLASADVQGRLKQAVTDAQKNLGALEPWQQAIFQEEVLTQYGRFIKDYRQVGGSVNVDVDQASLRNYLAFYAPKALGKTQPKIVTYARAEASCEKCVLSLPEIRRAIKGRMERRGLIPVAVSVEDVGADVTGRVLQDRLQALAEQKGASGFLLLDWRQKPVDSIDSAHADDKQYDISLSLSLKDSEKTWKSSGELDLLENDPLELAASRLMTDAMTGLGSQVLAEAASAAEDEGGVIELVLTGFGDFAEYAQAKARIEAALPEGISMEERKISKGKVGFEVRSKNGTAPLVAALKRVQVDSGDESHKLQVTETGADSVSVEIP